MPNIENLKKQAKLYLRWHRDGYYPVAAQIRALLPRFQHLTDQDVLAHNFKLSDAQELIARKAGFENWEALLKGVHTMSDIQAETLSKPILLAAEPQLFVADIETSCEFYTKKLGFTVAFVYGKPPFYGTSVPGWSQVESPISTRTRNESGASGQRTSALSIHHAR